MNESYEEGVSTPLEPMAVRQVVQVAIAGLMVGLLTWGLTWLVSTYVLSGLLCGGGATMQCVSALQYSEMTATILTAGGGLFLFVRLQVFRPLLVVLAATVSLWGIITMATGVQEYIVGLMCAVLFMLAYVLFAWVVRIRLFWLAMVLIVAVVVAVRLMLSA